MRPVRRHSRSERLHDIVVVRRFGSVERIGFIAVAESLGLPVVEIGAQVQEHLPDLPHIDGQLQHRRFPAGRPVLVQKHVPERIGGSPTGDLGEHIKIADGVFGVESGRLAGSGRIRTAAVHGERKVQGDPARSRVPRSVVGRRCVPVRTSGRQTTQQPAAYPRFYLFHTLISFRPSKYHVLYPPAPVQHADLQIHRFPRIAFQEKRHAIVIAPVEELLFGAGMQARRRCAVGRACPRD